MKRRKVSKAKPCKAINSLEVVETESKQLQYIYELTRKYYHNQFVDDSANRLQVFLIGNVIDAVSSFLNPKHICILDEVISSSREYKEGEASGWDDFLENMKSDMWDEMKYQSKASLLYMSKKKIQLKKINQMKYIGEYRAAYTMYFTEEDCFANIRLENMMEVDVSYTDITDADMAELGRAFPNLQKLNITQCENITDVGLIEFSRYCSGLKDMNMDRCRKITNAGLVEFSQNCRGLHSIQPSACYLVTAGGIEGISQHCRDLRIIKLGGGHYNIRCICTDADLLAVAINCQQLQEIYFDQCHEITDDGLIEMSKHLNSNQFHHITMIMCKLISNRGLIGFSKSCPYLNRICIRGDRDNFTDDCIVEVSNNCSGLESIDISENYWLTDRSIHAIAKYCHGLKNIKINKCRHITEVSFIDLVENCAGLESINISDTWSNDWLTDMSILAIAHNCHGLKRIYINGCKVSHIKEESFINLVEKCSGLENIKISSNEWVTDRSLNAIAKNCRNLKNLDIYNCLGITEANFINFIENCSRLETIDFGNNKWVTNISMISISKNRHCLRNIRFYGCNKITKNAKMAVAEGCPALRDQIMEEFNRCRRNNCYY